MSAITGLWSPPNKSVQNMVSDWMFRYRNWPILDQREKLTSQLHSIKNAFGCRHAKEFRNYLLWLGLYPSMIRKNCS